MKTLALIVDLLCWALICFAFGYFLAALVTAAPRIAEVAR